MSLAASESERPDYTITPEHETFDRPPKKVAFTITRASDNDLPVYAKLSAQRLAGGEGDTQEWVSIGQPDWLTSEPPSTHGSGSAVQFTDNQSVVEARLSEFDGQPYGRYRLQVRVREHGAAEKFTGHCEFEHKASPPKPFPWKIVAGVVGAVVAIVAIGAIVAVVAIRQCGEQDYRVRVVATGIVEPVRARLETGQGQEQLDIVGDGVFAFQTALSDGASFAVGFEVPRPGCIWTGASGVVREADVEIGLTCVTLDNLALVGARVPALDFAPTKSGYSAEVSLLQETVAVIATANRPGLEMAIAGRPATSGAPSEPVALALGETAIPVVVRHPESGAELGYQIAVNRTGAIAQAAYGKASNTGSMDLFGQSLALSVNGTTLAVGAVLEGSAATGVNGNQDDENAESSGAVYVFQRSGGTWAQQAYIKAGNTDRADSFGQSVALSASGDTLAVGATREASAATGVDGDANDNSASASGAVYVFQRNGGVWAQQAYIKAGNTGRADSFGQNVALSASGDILAVSAPKEDSVATGVDGDGNDNSALDSGAVYMFQRSGGTWAQQAYVKADNTGRGDSFGQSVALSANGDILAVGAYREDSAATGVDGDGDDNSALDSGAVYVFQRSGRAWAQQAYVKGNTGRSSLFGQSVALSARGTTLAIGVHSETSAAMGMDNDANDNSIPDSGTVYVFQRDGGTWAQQAYVRASNSDETDFFGQNVALSASGDTLAVTAHGDDSAATGVDGDGDDNSAPFSGAVYVFQRDGATWTQQAYVKASNTDEDDMFGLVALSANGDTLAVSAIGEASAATGVDGDQDDNSASDSGALYIFH